MLIDNGLELLTDVQCRDLLAGASVGRVGLTISALPAIFPVNYALVDGDVVFRTAPGSKLAAAARGAVVAFEVDDYDKAERSGWSVLAVGHAEIIDDVDMDLVVLAAGLEPWARGIRTDLVRVRTEFVSGRRIVAELSPSTRSTGAARAVMR
jgi:uncharacterized protein